MAEIATMTADGPTAVARLLASQSRFRAFRMASRAHWRLRICRQEKQ
jgi:hypothetical protein